MKMIGSYKGKPLFIEESILSKKGKLNRIDGWVITEVVPVETCRLDKPSQKTGGSNGK